MNKHLILLLFLCTTLTAVSQPTKLITNKYSGINQISENYSVLKSDRITKHGPYMSYFRATKEEINDIKKGYIKLDHFIKMKGNYINGKKYGEWIEYSKPSVFKSQGNYNDDKKVGIWLSSKEGGSVIEKYDYDHQIKIKPIIKVEILYPAKARDAGIEGHVKILYHVNSDCSISNFEIIQSVSNECDKEALSKLIKFGELSKKYSIEPICKESIDTFKVNFRLKE